MPRTCCGSSLSAAHCLALCVFLNVGVGGWGVEGLIETVESCLLRTHMRAETRLLSSGLCVLAPGVWDVAKISSVAHNLKFQSSAPREKKNSIVEII